MTRFGYKFLFFLLLGVLPSFAIAGEIRIFVSPNGNDAWSGQHESPTAKGADGPVRTLAQAQQLTRALLGRMRAGSEQRSTVRVVVMPGEFALRTPLIFLPADSGFADAPVIYEAQMPGSAVLTGGLHLTTRQVDKGMVAFDAPAGQASAIFGGGQLFVQGQRATLARMPDAGKYWFVEKAVQVAGEQGEPGREAFVPEQAARDWLAGIPSAERGRAVVNVMSSWSAGRHRLADNAPSGAIRVRPAGHLPFLKFGQSQRFFVENVSEALDKPGEWYWDAAEIRYIPRAGERADALDAVLPMLDRLVEVRGSPSQNAWVENLQFKGLSFRHTRSLISRDGFYDMQAAVAIGAAIEVDGARNFRFEACDVSAVGGYGLWFRQSVRNSAVVGSVFKDLGAGGVKVGLADQRPGDINGSGGNKVAGNTVTETGKVYPGAVGIWVGQSFDNEISFNTIANTTYTAISVGWKWGYGEARSGRNQIVGNLLYNIGQGMLSDIGAIYVLGVAPGTVISDNLIREVRGYRGYGPGAWGIYLDEGSSNIAVENNVAVGTDSGGLHLHFGRSNVVANNVFAAGGIGELLVSRSDPDSTQLSFKNNLLLPAGEKVFLGNAASPDVIFSGNRVSAIAAGRASDVTACSGGCSLSQAKLTAGADPRAVAISGGEAGFAQMVARVVARAGRLPAGGGESALVANLPAEKAVASRQPVSLLAPPKDFAVDFNLVANDVRPMELRYEPKENMRAIRVVRGNDIPGGACLLFEDGPQFPNRFDPHAYARVDFTSGEVLAGFAIKTDSNSEMIYEWRDEAKPYQSGPWLRISAKGVETHERLLTKLPPGPWLVFSISASLGDGAGKWRLSITDGAGKLKVFDNLPIKSSGWNQLKWLGFISDASVKSETCVGQIQVSRKK